MVILLEMPVLETPVLETNALDELLIEECEWNDAGIRPGDLVGLTPEDLAEWQPPGLPPELACEAFEGFDFAPAR